MFKWGGMYYEWKQLDDLITELEQPHKEGAPWPQEQEQEPQQPQQEP